MIHIQLHYGQRKTAPLGDLNTAQGIILSMKLVLFVQAGMVQPD